MFKQANVESGKRLAYCILVLSFFLLLFSPRVLSGDSSFYLYKAVMNEDLIHPHHLSYSLVLRGGILLGNLTGLRENPYLILRATMLLISWLGLWATYRFLRFLSFQRITSTMGTLLVSVSGLYWQFSTQTEAYVPAYAVLALAGCFVLGAGRLFSRKNRINRNEGNQYALLSSPVLRFISAAFLLALSTTLHQACALAAPSLGFLFFLITRRKDNISLSKSIFAAAFFCLLSGLFAVGFYLIGWMLSSPGVTFSHWLTKYAHWTGMPWGLWSNFSINGIKQLCLSWMASWLNITPFKFAHPLPYPYGILAVFCILSGVALALFLVVCSLRRIPQSNHIWWILLWIIPVEIFILWWTPFLKNFQAFTLLPQVTILALGAELLGSKLKNSTGIFTKLRSLPTVCLIFLSFALFVVNGKYLVLSGLKNRLAPEGDLLLVRPFLHEGDICVMEWPHYNIMKALLSYNNVDSIFNMGDPKIYPDWQGNPKDAKKVIAVHRSSIFLSRVALQRAGKTYDTVWSGFLNNLAGAAGGWDSIRGLFIPIENEPLLVIFGIDSDLPLSGQKTLKKIAEYSETASPDVPQEMGQFFLNRIPIKERIMEISHLQEQALKRGQLPEVLQLPFVNANKTPLWKKGIDTDRISVEKDSIKAHSKGRDPILYTTLTPPQDLYLFPELVIEASILAPQGKVRDTDIKIFFQYEGEQTSETRTVFIPWKADGKRYRKSLFLWNHPFYIKQRKVQGLRLDPGNIPDSEIEIREILFNSQPKSENGDHEFPR